MTLPSLRVVTLSKSPFLVLDDLSPSHKFSNLYPIHLVEHQLVIGLYNH